MENQIWKDVVGYDYHYQVSDIGIVKLLPRKTTEKSQQRSDRKNFIPGRILNQRIRAGYMSVVLRRNKKSFDCVVHRLVAIAFIPNPENKPCINHKDGNKINNKVDNLEWCTIKENTVHAYDIGLAVSGENHTDSKLSASDVLDIRKIHNTGLAGTKIAKKYGVHKNTIYHIINGKNWRRLKSN